MNLFVSFEMFVNTILHSKSEKDTKFPIEYRFFVRFSDRCRCILHQTNSPPHRTLPAISWFGDECFYSRSPFTSLMKIGAKWSIFVKIRKILFFINVTLHGSKSVPPFSWALGNRKKSCFFWISFDFSYIIWPGLCGSKSVPSYSWALGGVERLFLLNFIWLFL